MVKRIDRINEEIKKELMDIIQNGLKDPRIPKIISITSVSVTNDFKYATVYVSVFGSNDEKDNAIAGLKSAAGFIRGELGRRVQLRYTPSIQFKLDDSIEKGVELNKLINDTISQG